MHATVTTGEMTMQLSHCLKIQHADYYLRLVDSRVFHNSCQVVQYGYSRHFQSVEYCDFRVLVSFSLNQVRQPTVYFYQQILIAHVFTHSADLVEFYNCIKCKHSSLLGIYRRHPHPLCSARLPSQLSSSRFYTTPSRLLCFGLRLASHVQLRP